MSKQPKSHLKRLTTFDYINSAILLLVAVCLCIHSCMCSLWLPRMAPTWHAVR